MNRRFRFKVTHIRLDALEVKECEMPLPPLVDASSVAAVIARRYSRDVCLLYRLVICPAYRIQLQVAELQLSSGIGRYGRKLSVFGWKADRFELALFNQAARKPEPSH